MSTTARAGAVTLAVLMLLSVVSPAVLAAQPQSAFNGDRNTLGQPGGGPPDQPDQPGAGPPHQPGQPGGGPPGQPGGGSDNQDDSSSSEFDPNASSLELRIEAYSLLASANVRGGPNANEQLRERINGTFEYYVGPNRVNDVRIFDQDTAVIARTKHTAPEVSRRLLASQARLARAEMRDANRTIHVLQERDADFNERRSENQLTQARDHFDRGETRRERGQSNAAIAGYRHAFVRSHRLQNRLGRQTKPDLEIEAPWESAQEGAETGKDLTCIQPEDEGLTVNELIRVRSEHFSSIGENDYMFVTPRPDSDSPWLDSDNTGINLPDDFFIFSPEGMAVFTEPSNDENFGSSQISNSPYSDNLNISSAAVAMHEIGHSYGVGRNDEVGLEESVLETWPAIGDPDIPLTPVKIPIIRHVGYDSPAVTGGFEVYSGDGNDPTPEQLNGRSRWSLMATHDTQLAEGPMDGEYFVFSVEELTTIKNP